MRWLSFIFIVACTNPGPEICVEHEPTETRELQIGNIDRSVPLGTEFPFVPYEEGQLVVKEYGTQALTHLPVYLRVPARPEDGTGPRCVELSYVRGDFEVQVRLELERRDDYWVTRNGYQDVTALGEVDVSVVLRDAVFEGSTTIALEAAEPIEG